MSKTLYQRTFLIVAILMLLANGAFAKMQGPKTFKQVKKIQERHSKKLLSKNGIIGTAVCRDAKGQLRLSVLTERRGIRGIPTQLDGVPVLTRPVGKIYALRSPRRRWPRWRQRDNTPPAAPQNLMALMDDEYGFTQINLAWEAPPDPDVSHYNIYRSTVDGGPYRRIDAAPVEFYESTGLEPETLYFYVVTAVDQSGNESAGSNQAYAVTDTMPVVVSSQVTIGISTGHPNIGAGTIGCRLTDGTHYYILSNNHIFADENRAVLGDSILQPGPYDGGLDPWDAVAELVDFVPIRFSWRARNQVDAAIALLMWIDDPALGYVPAVGNAAPSYGQPSATTLAADTSLVGTSVQKHGRSTGLTTGIVSGVNVTIRVQYDSGVARFVNQIWISSADASAFSDFGDSGSLVVTESGQQPVGLLFAGSATDAFANPIDLVLDEFRGITMDGK